jgi:hypothetical protein
MINDRAEAMAVAYAYSINATLTHARDLDEGKRLRQLQEGAAHPLWVMGHLTLTLDAVVNSIGLGEDSILPRSYFDKFMFGPVDADGSSYPPWDEVVETYEAVGRRVVENIRAASDDDLARPPNRDFPEQNADKWSTLGKLLMDEVDHDAYHRGQMGLIAALD